MTDWLFGWIPAWLIELLNRWVSDWLVGWISAWLIELLTDG